MCRFLCGRCSHRSAKRSPQRKGLVAIRGPAVEKRRIAFRWTVVAWTVVAWTIEAFCIARVSWWKVAGKLGSIAIVISPIFSSLKRQVFTFFKKDPWRWQKPRHDASDDGAWIIAFLQPAYVSLDAVVIRGSPNQGINVAIIVGSVLPLFAKRAKFG